MAQENGSGGNPNAARWPVAPWKSLHNIALRFHEEQAVPPRIDRSLLSGLSGGQQTQVMSAMRFLTWINDTNEVQPAFTRFVNEEKERKKILKELLTRLYPEAAKLATVHATAAQYAETFAPYTADTLRKAMTFFQHAAQFSGLPLSKNFKVQRVSRAGKKARPANGASAGPAPASTASSAGAANGDTLDAARARYLEMLMEMAKSSDDADTGLLDRIEKLLGYEKP